jgi:hypothetical protein
VTEHEAIRRDERELTTPGTAVKLWRRTPSSKPGWSIHVARDATEAEVDRLVALALRADRSLAGRDAG